MPSFVSTEIATTLKSIPIGADARRARSWVSDSRRTGGDTSGHFGVIRLSVMTVPAILPCPLASAQVRCSRDSRIFPVLIAVRTGMLTLTILIGTTDL